MAYDSPIAAASQVIHASKVYIGDIGASQDEMVEIPMGESAITVNFKMKEGTVNIKKWYDKLEEIAEREKQERIKKTQAYAFDQYVRTVHNVPQDADTLKKLHVKGIYQALTTGYYKTVTLVFDDGSVYRAG